MASMQDERASEAQPATATGAAATAADGPRPAAAASLPPFALERFFARWEFKAKHLLCCSDSEPLSMADLLALADEDALERWGGLRLAYTETQGLPALREAIVAAHYSAVQAHQLVVAAPQEALYLCMRALLRPGDRVVCCFPGYQSLYEVARSIGCHVDLWQMRSGTDGSLSFSLEDAERLVRPGTRLVVVNAPHNPSGCLFSREEWRALCALCDRTGAYLFSDEMYRTLELNREDRLPAAADAYEKGISLSGCSKATVVQRIVELKDYTSICSSAPSEVLALAMLRNWDALAERSLALIRANLGTLQAFFARWAHVFSYAPPPAGTVCFPRLLTGEPVEAWCEELVQASGVLLMPATVYGAPAFTAEGRFRLGFGRANLPQCLARLDAWLVGRYGEPPSPAAGASE